MACNVNNAPWVTLGLFAPSRSTDRGVSEIQRSVTGRVRKWSEGKRSEGRRVMVGGYFFPGLPAVLGLPPSPSVRIYLKPEQFRIHARMRSDAFGSMPQGSEDQDRAFGTVNAFGVGPPAPEKFLRDARGPSRVILSLFLILFPFSSARNLWQPFGRHLYIRMPLTKCAALNISFLLK